ncbi:putative uncharacterized protein DDB_G0282133 [Vanessa atalanta]|uniref:putative uncharacterized protein DDB_G0282133 n=1 Tax=Vanessa atalanta TaxID=42275 RepID=UPI001FCDDB4B|nr:putative uncharacterized protein DDB_G0282133 [Vanessa atalanta]
MYLLRMGQINTRSQIDRRNGNNNARSTRDTVEKESLANREVRENVRPKMYHINMNSRLQLTEHETVVSRPDRRNRNNNARSTRNINEIDTSDNREVRDDFRHKINRVNMTTRLEMNERETVLSRLDRRNVNNNARSSRNSNEIEISENREVRETVGPKMNRVNMNSRLNMRERETVLSRLDQRNVNNNARTFRNTNEKEISENREVRENVGPKMNRVNMNSRLDMRERETVIFRPDRRNANNNARSTRNINEMETSEKREVRNDFGPKMNRVNMNSRLDMREREIMMSRLERRNVNSNARNTRNINGLEISVNRDIKENVAPKMNSRLEMRERETVIYRLDRRNANNNARSTRNINEMDTSEKREVRGDFGPKMNPVNMNSRLDMRERETMMSRLERRNVNSNARNTRNINGIEISVNRDVRENVGPKMNSRLEMSERETVIFRPDRRNANNNARSTRNINVMETSEKREVRDDFGLKMNRVNMNTRLAMKKRDIRGTNENMIIVRRRKVVTDLYRDNIRTVRRNVPSQEFRVNELRRSERIQRSINDATNTMSRRTREALSLSPENRIRYDARQNLRESQYVRSRENRINVERDERQRSYKHEISTDRIHINNLQRRVQIRASIRQDENRITSRNDRNFVSGIHISRSTTENENRQQSRNVISENQLSNRRHEVRNARDERRQTKMTQVDISIDMRRLATVRYEDNEKPIPVQKLQYEIHVFEMKWQYLFYVLQAVYIFSIIMKMPNSNQENKHTKWISTWFTPTKYLKMD